jgi:C4-dicarboxylate-specific signal transduction histidine kinase
MSSDRPLASIRDPSGPAEAPAHLLDACVLADRARHFQAVARELNHVLANALMILPPPKSGGVSGEATRARLDATARVLARMVEDAEEPGDAPMLVEDVLAEVDEWHNCQPGNPGVRLAIEVEGSIPPVRGRASHLRQALMALLTNARESVGERPGGEIRIIAAGEAPGAVIAVEDNGDGIPAELLERVFDPFHTTRDPARHLGLGLTAARRLAGRCGGELWAEVRPGRPGARLVIRLPAWGGRAGAR